jgi:DNA invertase Pin-like site-specific DNA recombinase
MKYGYARVSTEDQNPDMQSEVADAREAFRQDVLEKAAQKLFVSQAPYAPPAGMGVVFPTK